MLSLVASATSPCKSQAKLWCTVCSVYKYPCLPLAQVLLADIVTRLENMLGVLSTDGFSPLQQAYTDNWLHAGQRVRAPLIGWPLVIRACPV